MRRNKRNTRGRKRRNQEHWPLALILVIVGAVLIVAGFAFFPKDHVTPGFTPEVNGAPSLNVDKEQVDFGDVPFNQFVTAEFKLTNVGDETLRFTGQPYVELKAGC